MTNAYADNQRAESYAKLEFPATYYLAFRDLPKIIQEHVKGNKAIDFGCGAGRSTRFLRNFGFDVVGIDVSEEMIHKAKQIDPKGDYRLIAPGDFSGLQSGTYDLILCAFPFDNIKMQEKVRLFSGLSDLIHEQGRIVNLISSPEIYTREWTSFSTKDFPENRFAKTGDQVRIVITAGEDRRPVEDTFCLDEDYRNIYREAGLEILLTYKPLGNDEEPYDWINETRISPWVIYVLRRA